ncbi:unnamed protein product [Effrenium voratum]|uniref:Pentatricopeptide repeat-containing protein, chloroplastic n=1 Tax=Effrenium voratum TaxID=2562239 RepID=A0AA36I4B6_9DINO|nr:unnamed protein product [Effrenium voratum]
MTRSQACSGAQWTSRLAALGRQRLWRDALCTLQEMRSTGVEVSVFAQGAAIGALEKTSQWPGALALLSEAETATGLNAVLCGAALGACAKGKAWRQALLVLETMSFNALEVGVVACSVAMRCCEQEGEWQQALEVLRAMLGNAVLPDVIAYGTAMGACRHGGHWRGAFALLQDTSARRLGNEVVYSSAVSCCEAAGRADLAELLLRRMRHEKIRPNEITFNAAISACEKGRSWELALGFFEMLQQDGLQPDVVSINAGTSACEKGARWEEALGLFAAASRLQVKLDAISHNAAASTCEKGLQWVIPLQMLHSMPLEALEPSVVSFNSVVSACCGCLGWAWPLFLLQDLPRRRLQGTEVTCSAVLTAASARPEVFFNLLDGFRRVGRLDAISYSAAVHAVGQLGRWQDVVRLLQEMAASELEPGIAELGVALGACEGSRGLEPPARRLCQDLRDSAARLLRPPGQRLQRTALAAGPQAAPARFRSQARPSGQRLQRTALAFGPWEKAASARFRSQARPSGQRLQRTALAFGPWEKAASARFRSQARTLRRAASRALREVTALLAQCQKSGQWQLGFDILTGAMSAHVEADVIAVSIAAGAAQQVSAWGPSLALAEDATCRGIAPNQVSCGTLLASCGKARQWTQVLQALRTEPAPAMGAVGFNAALSACRTEWRRALLMLSSATCKRLVPDEVGYNSVADAVCQWAGAVALLRVAEEAELRIGTVALNTLMAQVSWRLAFETFGQMHLHGIEPSLVSSNSLGTAAVRGSVWQAALQDRTSSRDVTSFNVVLSALDRGEKPQTALRLFTDALRRRVALSVVSFGTVASACSRGARWAPALWLLDALAPRRMAPSQEVANSALLACSRAGAWPRTLELVKERTPEDEAGLVAVAMALEEAGRWQHALALLGSGLRSATLFVAVCSACTRGRQWEQAAEVLEAMSCASLRQDVASQGAQLQLLSSAHAGLWRQALHFAPGAGPGILRNFALASCEQVRQWAAALALCSQAAQAFAEPDVNTFGLLLGSHAAGQWERSVTILKELVCTRLPVNEVHLGAAITAQESAWPAAIFWLGGFRRFRLRLNESAFGAALQACSEPAWQAALALAEDLGARVVPTLPLLAMKSAALEKGRCWQQKAAVLHAAGVQGLQGLDFHRFKS